MANIKDAAQFQFEKAFFEGDLAGVERALINGAQVDAPIEASCALSLAVKYDWADRAELLLRQGASPWSRQGAGPSPMSLAVDSENHEMARLLSAGSSETPSEIKLWELLTSAVSNSRVSAEIALGMIPLDQRQKALDEALDRHWDYRGNDELGLLLALGGSPFTLVNPDSYDDWMEVNSELEGSLGPIPLIVGLAQRGLASHIDATGAQIERLDWTMQAFSYACDNGDADTLMALSRRGCHPERFPAVALDALERLCAEDMEFESPLKIAAHARCVSALVRLGVAIEGNPKHRTPLMIALSAGNLPVAVALLELGADPLARRRKEGVMSLAKPFMEDPEFARGYAVMLASLEAKELSSTVSKPRAPSKKARARI